MSRQFTTEAEKALNKAAKFAIRMGQRIVGSEHLLFGLSAAPGVAAKVLKENGIRKNGYIESTNWVITWCVGHLVTMSYP